MEPSKILQNHTWKITIATLLLLLAGLMTLFSTGLGSGDNIASSNSEIGNQIAFVVVGLVFYFGLMFLNYTYFRFIPVQGIITVFLVLPLLMVLFVGITRNNATRWFQFGEFSLQPSEFAKPLLTLTVAFVLTQLKKLTEEVRALIAIGTTVLIAALILVEPDLSIALIILSMGGVMFLAYTRDQFSWFGAFLSLTLYILTFTGVIYLDIIPALVVQITSVKVDLLMVLLIAIPNLIVAITKKNFRFFALGSLLASIVIISSSSFVFNNVLRDYQRERVQSFLQIESKDQHENFQVQQARVAIGSGRLFGKGFGQGTQSKLNFLPEHRTDFIFAAFAEEFGWSGSVLLIIVYLVLVVSIIEVAFSTSDGYGFIVAIGIATMFLFEVFVNIGVNLGIMPATGIPLPLMSLGGSSMITKLIALGLVQSIALYSNKRVERDLTSLVDTSLRKS